MKPTYKEHRDGRQVCLNTAAGKRDYRHRTVLMVLRQEGLCGLCGLPMAAGDISFDHEHGRGMGGAKRDDRIEVEGKRQNAAVHIRCNGEKGSRMVPYIVQ